MKINEYQMQKWIKEMEIKLNGFSNGMVQLIIKESPSLHFIFEDEFQQLKNILSDLRLVKDLIEKGDCSDKLHSLMIKTGKKMREIREMATGEIEWKLTNKN